MRGERGGLKLGRAPQTAAYLGDSMAPRLTLTHQTVVEYS